jgi:3-deoxy-manno-octulosonate cytidylyltransferase (CMP-KDO synthetase)
VAQAADLVDPEKHFGVVVNVQGDLPGLDPQMVRDVLKPLGDGEKNYHIATIASPLGKGEKDRSSVVKIALARPHGPGTWAQALYFSRAPIPFGSPEEGWHHIGLYAYRRQALERMVALAPSLLEKSENLEQLRAMEAGMTLGVYLTATLPPLGVDTPEDLERVRALIAPC